MRTTVGLTIGKSLNYMMGILLVMQLTACNKGEDIHLPSDGPGNGNGSGQVQEAQLELIVSKKGSLLGQNTWYDGNTLGIFLTEGNLGSPYLGDKDSYYNIKATMLAGTWYLKPEEVLLKDKEAVVYAYSPYENGVDPFAVPVIAGGEVDYMFGTHLQSQKAVDKDNETAAIEMQHALALIDFNVRKNHNFKGQAMLQQIALESVTDSIKIPVKGTMDIMTGKLTPDGYGRYCLDNLQQVLPDEYRDSCTYRMMVMPRDNAQDEVQLTIMVNGNRISLPLDADNDWQQGVRNTYNIVFEGTDLRIEKIEIAPWREINIEGQINGK